MKAVTKWEILAEISGYDLEELEDRQSQAILQPIDCIHAMQIYADSYHKKKLRADLKSFNNFMLKQDYDGKIPLIDACIDEYLKPKQ